MINIDQMIKVAEPFLKQAGKFIKENPHLLIEGGLASGIEVR